MLHLSLTVRLPMSSGSLRFTCLRFLLDAPKSILHRLVLEFTLRRLSENLTGRGHWDPNLSFLVEKPVVSIPTSYISPFSSYQVIHSQTSVSMLPIRLPTHHLVLAESQYPFILLQLRHKKLFESLTAISKNEQDLVETKVLPALGCTMFVANSDSSFEIICILKPDRTVSRSQMAMNHFNTIFTII